MHLSLHFQELVCAVGANLLREKKKLDLPRIWMTYPAPGPALWDGKYVLRYG